ncbi:putative P450 monooxygenase [Lophiotrema nucula]|uniref:Putative P450 monooxygenase n=1 Tax=Lophiotrema nucula TaxID=690887 RepID=A0A6A5ZKT5_9PLEO|nr:putative P450 monooxygenase [Lophiotrema nucula]
MNDVAELAFQHPILILLSSYLLYLLSLAIYRLSLDPLRKFPGPRLAAATQLYEFYYDFIAGGQYTFRILEMHKKYGPIVRISPCELHIETPDFYDTLYSGSSNPREKWEYSAKLFGIPTAMISAVLHDSHRAKRAPLNHFFSKRSVLMLEPMVRGMVEKLSSRISGFKGTGQPLNMRNATAALAMDVVTQYAFANPYGSLDEEDFAPHWPDAVDALEELTYLNVYFPRLADFLRRLPLWISKRLDPKTASVVEFQMSLARQIDSIMKEDAEKRLQKTDHPTIFHEFLWSEELPINDRTPDHFLNEAVGVVAAGQVTTAYHLQQTFWYILSAPGVLNKLRAELDEAMPDSELPSIQKLEELPYLSAVVSEGHRMTHGVAHRLPRVSPKDPIIFKEWVIPPGTPVSMTHMLTHQNASIFPDPFTFRPERWIGPEAKELNKYLTPFGKGTRSCLGMHLAQAELYMTIAALIQRFEFEVWETTQGDMDIVVDYFVPMPKRGSKGLRVLVK